MILRLKFQWRLIWHFMRKKEIKIDLEDQHLLVKEEVVTSGPGEKNMMILEMNTI